MSNTLGSLRNKINAAGDLRSVVRTMKSVAAASIGQYEKSVLALTEYNQTVELGLSICFRKKNLSRATTENKSIPVKVGVVVFGSDQGLVGQFNDVITQFAMKTIITLTKQAQVWAVGERVHAMLMNERKSPIGLFSLPHSIETIAPLVGQILTAADDFTELHLFYNKPQSASGYEPAHQKLLPLDEKWHKRISELPWSNQQLPEVVGDFTETLKALIHEYLFVSLYRACADSLASENASRLAAMQRADKNIDELLTTLNGNFHRLRQNGIDEELFDVISGFEAIQHQKN